MLTLSHIMQDDWRRYHRTVRSKPFEPLTFKFYLGCAWDAARMAQQTEVERRIDALNNELAMLEFKPHRINIDARRATLQAELDDLINA